MAMLVTQPTKATNKNADKNRPRPTPPPYAYDPTPGSKYLISPTPQSFNRQVAQPSFKPNSRGKRNSEFMSDNLEKPNISDDVLKEMVKQVMQTMIANNQQLGEVNATIKHDRSNNAVDYQLKLPTALPYHGHHEHQPEHPPTITSQELPAPPGCRSLATKECVAIPVSVPRKVPYSVCRTVPDIDCVHVLKSVPELQCTPEVYRDCADYEVRIPYLEEDEECEEIIFDECLEVRCSNRHNVFSDRIYLQIEEKIPVEVCTTIRNNVEAISLSRGQAVRKEGEKRRQSIPKDKGKFIWFVVVDIDREGVRRMLTESKLEWSFALLPRDFHNIC